MYYKITKLGVIDTAPSINSEMLYTVVVPIKNEEKFVERTIKSVISQTVQPQLCLFMDDGSTDNSAAIIKEYCDQYPFLQYHYFQRADNQNSYVLGGHVVDLLFAGKEIIDQKGIDYEYIIKLDGDIEFDSTFIESVWNKIKDGHYGIVSGTPYYIYNSKKIHDIGPSWHSRGQFKIYNKECFEQIGGPPRTLGWDCADNIRAMEAGWETQTFREAEYLMDRIIGGKFSSSKGRINHGVGAYLLGYHPLYFSLRLVRNILRPPYLIGSYYLLLGYLKSMFTGVEKTLTPNQIKILRKLHWKGLRNKVA